MHIFTRPPLTQIRKLLSLPKGRYAHSRPFLVARAIRAPRGLDSPLNIMLFSGTSLPPGDRSDGEVWVVPTQAVAGWFSSPLALPIKRYAYPRGLSINVHPPVHTLTFRESCLAGVVHLTWPSDEGRNLESSLRLTIGRPPLIELFPTKNTILSHAYVEAFSLY
ncbi:hypothetical protein BV22DRAFT_1032131 [Leucogyrophana mollusca]|uniref:Uncharacterized protein n=1 Tax=Leucogyrophana mollusca TaxID=85980 RepID=A0ACB8BQL2_9AGAM|nr:hypothetical protein BV22DRAFT_1032131 [Leucogyrophana mollusca]